jgi:nucleoside-diphosphate-sugar epimerase
MPVIVVGAGYTGQRVLGLLPAEEVTGFRRAQLDLDDPPDRIPNLPAGYSLLYTVPPAAGSKNDQRLDALLERLETPPQRFVYLSTTGVYGNHDGGRIDEQTPPAPLSKRAERRLAAERSLTMWCDEKQVELIILRVPAIYGPGRLGIDRLESGMPVIAESEASPGNRIHVDDLATCCVLALTKDVPQGIYNVGDGDHRSASWFTKTVAKLAGLEPPTEISRDAAEQSFSESRLSFLNESRIVDTNKMRTTLGFVPRYTDPEAGIRASLREGVTAASVSNRPTL